MPIFDVKLSNGATLSLEADREPTEQEIIDTIDSYSRYADRMEKRRIAEIPATEGTISATPETPVRDLFRAGREALSPMLGPTETQALSRKPLEGASRVETEGFIPAMSRPLVPLPTVESETGQKITKGVASLMFPGFALAPKEDITAALNEAIHFAEFMESPVGVATAGAAPIVRGLGRMGSRALQRAGAEATAAVGGAGSIEAARTAATIGARDLATAKALQAAISGGFGLDISSQIPTLAQEAGRLQVEGTPFEKATAEAQLGVSALLGPMLGAKGVAEAGKALRLRKTPQFPSGRTYYAPNERQIEEARLSQYQGADALGLSPEAGYRNRPTESRALTAEEVADLRPTEGEWQQEFDPVLSESPYSFVWEDLPEGKLATINREASLIRLSDKELVPWLRSLPEAERDAGLRSVIGQEEIHHATPRGEGAKYLATVTAPERVIGRRIATGEWRPEEPINDEMLGQEMIAFRIERLNRMPATELLGTTRGERWTLRSIDALASIIRGTREALGTKASKAGREILDRVEKRLGLIRQATYLYSLPQTDDTKRELEGINQQLEEVDRTNPVTVPPPEQPAPVPPQPATAAAAASVPPPQEAQPALKPTAAAASTEEPVKVSAKAEAIGKKWAAGGRLNPAEMEYIRNLSPKAFRAYMERQRQLRKAAVKGPAQLAETPRAAAVQAEKPIPEAPAEPPPAAPVEKPKTVYTLIGGVDKNGMFTLQKADGTKFKVTRQHLADFQKQGQIRLEEEVTKQPALPMVAPQVAGKPAAARPRAARPRARATKPAVAPVEAAPPPQPVAPVAEAVAALPKVEPTAAPAAEAPASPAQLVKALKKAASSTPEARQYSIGLGLTYGHEYKLPGDISTGELMSAVVADRSLIDATYAEIIRLNPELGDISLTKPYRGPFSPKQDIIHGAASGIPPQEIKTFVEELGGSYEGRRPATPSVERGPKPSTPLKLKGWKFTKAELKDPEFRAAIEAAPDLTALQKSNLLAIGKTKPLPPEEPFARRRRQEPFVHPIFLTTGLKRMEQMQRDLEKELDKTNPGWRDLFSHDWSELPPALSTKFDFLSELQSRIEDYTGLLSETHTWVPSEFGPGGKWVQTSFGEGEPEIGPGIEPFARRSRSAESEWRKIALDATGKKVTLRNQIDAETGEIIPEVRVDARKTVQQLRGVRDALRRLLAECLSKP